MEPIEVTDEQLKSLAEYLMSVTLNDSVSFHELDGFVQNEWINGAIEALDGYNDVIAWVKQRGIII